MIDWMHDTRVITVSVNFQREVLIFFNFVEVRLVIILRASMKKFLAAAIFWAHEMSTFKVSFEIILIVLFLEFFLLVVFFHFILILKCIKNIKCAIFKCVILKSRVAVAIFKKYSSPLYKDKWTYNHVFKFLS